jgi:hypothetical protein
MWDNSMRRSVEPRLTHARRPAEEDRMNPAIETTINELREAISSYQAYCHLVERGTLLVNADDGPADVIEAARLNVASCIEQCRSLGLTDHEIENLFAGDGRGA